MKKIQRYVAKGNVELRKSQGWKVARITDDKIKKIIGRNDGDLVLMEKEA